jgi:uncharacterized protein (TIGR02246 family)
MRLVPNLLFALILISSAAVPCRAQTPIDQAAVRNIPQAFAAAWATHDGHELAKIMSEDVDFINVGGDWLHGRHDFELYHSRLLAGRFRESKCTVRDTAVRFLRPNLAVVHWRWGIEGDKNEDLTARPPRYGIFTMAAEKRGAAWLVVEAQNTNWLPGPNPELDGIHLPIIFPAVEDKH